MNTAKMIACWIAAWMMLLCFGCGAPDTGSREVSPVPPRPDEPAGTQVMQNRLPSEASSGQSLKQYLTTVADSQYTAGKNLYIPPPQQAASTTYYQLNREPAVLYLDQETSTYTSHGKGLAVGREDGVIRVFGGGKCGGVLLPGGKPVQHLSWYPSSALLAAASVEGKQVAVFDLRQCGEVYAPSFNATLAAAAISPHGTWLAAVDTLHRLWVGPAARGPMTKAADLRYQTLALAFTPQEGLLMAVDEAGWLTLWAPLAKKNVDSILVPFGPFKKAEFHGQYIDLEPVEGEPVRWDIVAKKVVNMDARPNPFDLKNGVLRYRTFRKRMVKKVHLRPPTIGVRLSPKNNVFEVSDLDGKSRYYSEKDGSPVIGTVQADDWVPVKVASDGRFSLDDVEYALADRVFQRDHMRLNCRFIKGSGYFLWWDAAVRPNEFNPKPGYLPERQTLQKGENVQWVPLEESGDLI